jgi:fucose 4-O-acetylase-like acetyltransferase
MQNNLRLDDVSILRSIAIVSVVFMHAFGAYTSWGFIETPLQPVYNSIFYNWWGFRMPLFIFISGYLFSYLLNERGKYASLWGFIKKKFVRLVIPYLLFSGLIGLTYRNLTLEQLLNGYEHLWFILMLFWCFIFARLLSCFKWIKENFLLQILTLFFFLLISLFYRYETDPLLSFNNLINYFVWFWFGYVLFLNRSKLLWAFQYKYILLFAVGWIICCLYIEFLCPKDDSMLGFKTGFQYDLIKYFSYFFFILSVYFFINRYIEKGFSAPQWADNLNTYSYGIYIFHHWIMRYLFVGYGFPFRDQIYEMANQYHIRFPVILFISSFIISLLITKCLLRFKIGRFLIG